MNIDSIKIFNEDVVSCVTTLMSYGYLPYMITLPSRITDLSMTCIDHLFVRLNHREKVLNIVSGLFYCDINDHLPSFVSIDEKNMHNFVRGMETENLNEKYINGGDYYTKFITIVLRIFQRLFPAVRLSRKHWQDKPWMTKALKISIKCKKLYKACLVHPGNSMHEKYRTYKNIPRKCLKEAEIKYYEELFDNRKKIGI